MSDGPDRAAIIAWRQVTCGRFLAASHGPAFSVAQRTERSVRCEHIRARRPNPWKTQVDSRGSSTTAGCGCARTGHSAGRAPGELHYLELPWPVVAIVPSRRPAMCTSCASGAIRGVAIPGRSRRARRGPESRSRLAERELAEEVGLQRRTWEASGYRLLERGILRRCITCFWREICVRRQSVNTRATGPSTT